MDPTVIVALIGAVSTIAAAFIGRQRGAKSGREEKVKEIDDAPRKYVDHLDRLIQSSVEEGDEKAVLNARAIVSLRNDLRNSMIRISEYLNSEIDRLSKEIGEASSWGGILPEPRPVEEVFDTLQVLAKKWPGKKAQVEVELRKVLAELGLLGHIPGHMPDVDRPAPPFRKSPSSAAGVE